MTLTAKNWASFQHYKNRNPPWIKLHKTLLDDPDFQCLPVASRALAPMLWLIASERVDGAIPMTINSLAFRLRCSNEAVIAGLGPLLSSGLFFDDSDMLAGCYQVAVPEERREETKGETEAEIPTQGDKSITGTIIPALAGFTEGQDDPNIDEPWEIPEDDFEERDEHLPPLEMDPLELALRPFSAEDQKTLLDNEATVESCGEIADLMNRCNGTLEEVKREAV